MKAKTITKTFYASDSLLNDLKSENLIMTNKCIYTDKSESPPKNQIQISWQEPEKKVEITESEFENILESLKEKTQWRSYLDIIEKELKQQLFGVEKWVMNTMSYINNAN